MQVNDIMSSSVRTVSPETKLVEVASLMCLYRYSGLRVVDDDNNLLGIVTEKDLLHKLFPSLDDLMEGFAGIDLDEMMGQYKSALSMKVSDIMSKGVKTTPPEMHILRAATVMVRHRFRRIPVARDGRVAGMISHV
ncbi:MAG: CBS domain-containing protein [Arenicellales bacterium]